MVKTYYKSEYTEEQWKALIDKAIEWNIAITYNVYGSRVVLDSTVLENRLLADTKAPENKRHFWAETIHEFLQKAAERPTEKNVVIKTK